MLLRRSNMNSARNSSRMSLHTLGEILQWHLPSGLLYRVHCYLSARDAWGTDVTREQFVIAPLSLCGGY